MARSRTQDEKNEIRDKAYKIFIKTKDGKLLDNRDLKMTVNAANGRLNNASREVFEKLYRRVVIDGTYTTSYLHNIEHLTRDHMGYIYYKGNYIEHYDSDYVFSEDAKKSLLELKRRCEFLEIKGIEVSNGNVTEAWHNYADEYGAQRLKELDALLGGCGLKYSRVEIYNTGREFSYFACGQTPDSEEIRNHPITQSMLGRYLYDEYEITVGNFIYKNKERIVPPSEINNTAEIVDLLESCHDYLLKHRALKKLPDVKYKTDFAEGYEKTKQFESLLGRPGRSLQYSELYMYGYGYEHKKLYIIGTPTADEVEKSPEYQTMLKSYGDRLNILIATFRYGNGKPLNPEELPHISAVTEALGDAHHYLRKYELSHETGWRDHMHGFGDKNLIDYAAYDFVAESGYEP